MAISLNSRYASGHVTRAFPDPRRYKTQSEARGGYLGPVSSIIPVVVRTTKETTPVSATYVWKQGDRWDLVAERFGLPRTDWWVLLDVNPHLEFPCAMRPGTYVNIPTSVRRRVT